MKVGVQLERVLVPVLVNLTPPNGYLCKLVLRRRKQRSKHRQLR